MIAIEEGEFYPLPPRHIRRMLPLDRQKYMARYVHRRVYRFRVNAGRLFWPVGSLRERRVWCEESGVQGWDHRKVDWGDVESRGATVFMFEREVDAVAFVIRWA